MLNAQKSIQRIVENISKYTELPLPQAIVFEWEQVRVICFVRWNIVNK
jgi:hypothetical protein